MFVVFLMIFDIIILFYCIPLVYDSLIKHNIMRKIPNKIIINNNTVNFNRSNANSIYEDLFPHNLGK